MIADQTILDDVPRHLTSEDYEIAKSRFASMCRWSGIEASSYGFFGKVSCPGISDIDALAIGTSSQLRRLRSMFREERHSSERFAAMFWHPPLYVLDTAADSARFLHTLDSLEGPVSARLPENVSVRDSDYRLLLNIVWFTYLLRVCACMFRSPAVSLRKLLLVYNNLEFSQRSFSDVLGEQLAQPENSSVIRATALESSECDSPRLLRMFEERFEASLELFDSCCDLLRAKCGPASTCASHLIIGRSSVVKEDQSTGVDHHRWFTIIEANALAYSIAGQFLFARHGQGTISTYVRTSWACVSKYQKVDLDYPFITPFSIGVEGSKPGLLRIVNRCMKCLTR